MKNKEKEVIKKEYECNCDDNCNCTEENNCGCIDDLNYNCDCDCDECNSEEDTGCSGCHGCSDCDEDEFEKKNLDNTKLKEAEDKYLRLQAEFINFRTRSANEVADMLRYEGEDIIKNLLPIADNFERAIKMDDKDLSDEVSKFLEGFKMIYTSLMSIFKESGVTEIDCFGKEFDPIYMEAVLVEQDNNKPEGVVLEVLNKGYKYKDKVIRPAMVKVNK